MSAHQTWSIPSAPLGGHPGNAGIPVKTESVVEAVLPLLAPQLITHQAAERPNAIAIVAGSEVLTYAELERQSNQLAHYLLSAGVGRERLVGLYLKRSSAFVVAALAALKCGAAYLPLDPEVPAARVAFMLQDSGVSAVVTSEKMSERLPNGSWRVVDVVGDAAQLRQQSPQAPEAKPHSEDLAYVIYTSGSTGQPKGVEVTHGS